MTPSNTLSYSDASWLALKVLEFPIVRDYIAETHGTFEMLLAQVRIDEDWWDISHESYCAMLSRRHSHLKYDVIVADRNIKRPDLSTFNGPYVLRGAFGDVIARPPVQPAKPAPGRSEIYEIKPDNDRGAKKGREKLDSVEESYRNFAIAGIYKRGSWYPFRRTTKRIELKGVYRDLFLYLVNLHLRTIDAEVIDIYITIRRAEDGVLLYKICVVLDGLDDRPLEVAWMVANFAVRTFHKVAMMAQAESVRAAADKLLFEAQPVIPRELDPKKLHWIIAGKDYRRTPYLEIRAGDMAGEIEPQLSGIRNTMYSRLIGAPGERYFICCDENWYLANVRVPGLLRAQNVANMLGTGNLVRSAHASSLLGLTPAMITTAGQVVRTVPELQLRMAQWVVENPGKAVLIVAVTICVTALIVATAGAAMPLLLGSEAGLLGGGAVVATEAGAMAVPLMATTAGAEVATIAAVPVASAGTSGVVAAGTATATGTVGAEAGATTMLNLLRTMATQVTAAEVRAAAGQEVVDNVLIRVMTSPATQQVVRRGAVAAAKVGAAAGVVLVAVAPSQAYAYSGPTNGPVNASQVNANECVDLGTGHVHLVRVPKILAFPNTKPPKLYTQFNASAFAAEPLPPDTPLNNVYMLGSFDVI